MNISRLLGGLGNNFDDASVVQNLREWEKDVFKVLEAKGRLSDTHRFSSHVPLELLPIQERNLFMQRYRDIIGLDLTLNTMGLDAEQMWNSMEQVPGKNKPYGRMPVSHGDNSVVGRIHRALNLQRRDTIPYGSVGESSYFQVGQRSIQKIDSLLESPTSVPSLVGKKITVFDIETASLQKGQIREIAYQTLNGDSNGKLISVGDPQQIHFRTAAFNRGMMTFKNSTMRLEEFMRAKFGIDVSRLTGSGDEYVERVRPFLDLLNDSDYIVGHNLSKFDVEQVFHGLAGTSRYKNDETFKKYVDDSFTKVRGSMIDTLELARNAPNLAGITASRYGTKGDLFSIENLLLRTDLATRIGIEDLAQAMGMVEEVTESGERIITFTKGLHHGDVDTLVTRALLEHMEDLKLKSDMKVGFTGRHARIAAAVHSQIKSSSAIIPMNTLIKDISELSPNTLARFGISSQDEFTRRGLKITPFDELVLQTRDLSLGLGEIPTGALDPAAMSTRVRLFDQAKADGINAVKKMMTDNYMPFAGLSMEEREIGTALSRLTSGIDVSERSIARLSSDTLISRYSLFDLHDIQYAARTGRATLPAQVLQDAGILGGEGKPSMLRLSTLDETLSGGQKGLNLVYQFEKGEVDSLITKLKGMALDKAEFERVMGLSPGSDPAIFARFKQAMEGDALETALKRGSVTVGQIYGDDVVDDIYKVLGDAVLVDPGALTDDDLFRFGVAFMDTSVDETGQGIVRGAGLINTGIGNELMTDADFDFVRQSVERARTVYGDVKAGNGYIGMMGHREARVWADLLDKNIAAGTRNAAEKALTNYVRHIKPNLGRISLGAAVVGAAGFLLHKKNELDQYDVALTQMPTESGRYKVADYLEAQMAAGQNRYRQQVDPLATASIVSNLNATKIGHSNMSWDRNTNLYGGVL